ncbi:MAG TPA: DNA polymerase III subunit gamma/tau [Tissierellia bacterium]|nr:DNA polymerase III subunit gamma/tau [Tissierellia bacterium]
MSYLALYRKYRPVDFDDFAGQTEITDSLRYQVKTSSFGHSYLFNGIRGTGKTSMAKVFSKAINCLDPQAGNPCNKCSACVAFNNNAQMDVIEIDAASNNGVDDIRDLRENSHFVPASSKYKVYIIDEVQMLSQAAFNALLKTLEEPSKQVVFILATTELHKIPETILSRCQRYTFRRIDQQAMIERMEYVAKSEGVDYELSALRILSDHAGGAVRDALSMMDKTLSLARGRLTEEAVRTSLGLLGRERTDQLLRAVFSGRIDDAMGEIDQILREGKEIGKVLEECLDFLRALLMTKLIPNRQRLDQVVSFEILSFSDHYREIEAPLIQQTIDLLDETLRKLRFASLPRLSLEMALIKAAQLGHGLEQVEVKKVVEKRKIEVVSEEPPAPEVIKPQDIPMLWERTLRQIREAGHQHLFFLLSEGKIEGLEGDQLRLKFEPGGDYYVKNIQSPEHQKALKPILSKVFGPSARLIPEAEKLPEPKEEAISDLDMLKAFVGDTSKLNIK